MDLEDAFEDLRWGADVADAPAGHGISLGEAAHQDGPAAHSRQRTQRPHLVAAVDQPVVDLIAVHEQVVADGDAGDLILGLGRQDGAGGIARVVDQHGLGSGRDRRFHLGRIECEVLVDGRRNSDGNAARKDDRGPVRDVRGFVKDDLVARINGGPNGNVQRLGRADRDQDFLGRVVFHAV